MAVKLFLDTCSINALSGLDERGFELLRNMLEKSNSKLYASHIQVDERYDRNPTSYAQKCEKAFRVFEKHGIKINLEPTKYAVADISRFDLCRPCEEDIAEIDSELRNEIKKCMEEKGKYDGKPFDEKAIANIVRDCLIAITSADYDYFITSDDCLYKSWSNILQKDETRKVLGRMPNIVYVEPHPERILDQIRLVLK